MGTLTLTVCELPDEAGLLDERWDALCEAVRRDGTDLVLLPELPFAPWLCAAPEFDEAAWRAAVALDERWRARLPELGAAVITTRPVVDGAERRNEAYLWTGDAGAAGLRAKAHLPHEEGFWERSWFTAAPPEPGDTITVGPVDVGVLICSELWRFELAHHYHRAGAGLILVPRASAMSWCERWLACGRSVALLSGAWCASANRRGGAVGFGGDCWIIDPDGQIAARTSVDRPIVSAVVDADLADLAGERYPRTVLATETATV